VTPSENAIGKLPDYLGVRVPARRYHRCTRCESRTVQWLHSVASAKPLDDSDRALKPYYACAECGGVSPL